jgi:hypothetical protein
MKEIWKDITLDYQVSNKGRVKSKERYIKRTDGKLYKVIERIMKPAQDGNGYLRVALTINNKLTTFKVHRLVAQVFLKNSNLEVNHKDGCKTNNELRNLEFVTHSQNLKHAFKLGLAKPSRGEQNPKSKLIERDVLAIRNMFKDGFSSREIAKAYKMDKSTMLDIKNRVIWKHV